MLGTVDIVSTTMSPSATTAVSSLRTHPIHDQHPIHDRYDKYTSHDSIQTSSLGSSSRENSRNNSRHHDDDYHNNSNNNNNNNTNNTNDTPEKNINQNHTKNTDNKHPNFISKQPNFTKQPNFSNKFYLMPARERAREYESPARPRDYNVKRPRDHDVKRLRNYDSDYASDYNYDPSNERYNRKHVYTHGIEHNDSKRRRQCAPEGRRVYRAFIYLILAIAVTYYAYQYLQHVYYRQCKSNVLMAVLFHKSVLCIQIDAFLTTIEHAWEGVMSTCFKAMFMWNNPATAVSLYRLFFAGSSPTGP
jgi:hypothetical protein